MAIAGLPSTIAATGMQAATQRMQAAASNTANRETEGFARREVVQSEAAGGGVQTRLVATGATTDSGGAAIADAVNARQAALDFAASATVFRARGDALGTLLDAFA